MEFVAPETWHTGSRVIEKYMYIQSYFVFSYPEPHRAAAVQELRYWCRGYATHCYTPSFVDENLERKKDKERERKKDKGRVKEREKYKERDRQTELTREVREPKRGQCTSFHVTHCICMFMCIYIDV